MTSRRGFALITVLLVMVAAATMTAAAALAGRNSVNATRNRTQLTRAYWIATGCSARTRAGIDERLARSETIDDAVQTWRALGRVLPTVIAGSDECDITLEAAGSRLDVNASTDESLSNVLRAIGYGESDAAKMVDGLADWRDSDNVARPEGAEGAWYESVGKDVPRNGPFADIREVARVRGFEDIARFDSVLTVTPGRISLATAPVSVLLSLPGFTLEAAERVVALRDAGTPLANLLSLLGMVSETSRESLLSRYPDIVRLATTEPDAWMLTVRARNGSPPSSAVLRLRLQRAGMRTVVTDIRTER